MMYTANYAIKGHATFYAPDEDTAQQMAEDYVADVIWGTVSLESIEESEDE